MDAYYQTGHGNTHGTSQGPFSGPSGKTIPFLQASNLSTGSNPAPSLVSNSSTLNQAHYHDFSPELESKIRQQINSLGRPSTFGPGGWGGLHTMAKWANTKERVDIFITYAQVIVYTLLCLECRKHATNYFNDNHPSQYALVKDCRGRLVGMFLWSWRFHNTVNVRLGKPIIDFDTAFNMYPEYDQIILNTKGDNQERCDGPCPSDTSSSNPPSSNPHQANISQSTPNMKSLPKITSPSSVIYRVGGY